MDNSITAYHPRFIRQVDESNQLLGYHDSQNYNQFLHPVSNTIGDFAEERDENGRLHIFNLQTGDAYGKDSDSVLRLKFAELFVAHALLFPLMFLARLIDIGMGGFIHRGRASAEHIFTLEMKNDPALRGKELPPALLRKEIAKQLTYDIARLILFPLALPLKMAISLGGLISPLDARTALGYIERFFYIRPQDIMAPLHLTSERFKKYNYNYPHLPLLLATRYYNIAAFCMQPIDFIKKENLWRTEGYHYHPDSSLTRHTALKRRLAEISLYLPASDPIITSIRAQLPTIKGAIEALQGTNEEEVTALLNNEPLDPNYTHGQALKGIEEQLEIAFESWKNTPSETPYTDQPAYQEARNRAQILLNLFNP